MIATRSASDANNENSSLFLSQGPPDFHLISRRDVNPTVFLWNGKTVDYVLLTVNEHEFLAAYEILKDPSKSSVEDLGPVYFGGVGNVEVALVEAEMGAHNNTAAQKTCKKAVRLIKPKAFICLGVCFGLLEEKQNLGDLLISRNIQRYARVRVNADSSETPRSDSYLVNSELFKLFKDGQNGWNSQLSGRSVKVHTGTILSGPELIDNAERRMELKTKYREALGGETESEGIRKN